MDGKSTTAIVGNLAYKLQPEAVVEPNPLAPDPLKYTSVTLSDVYSNNTRLEPDFTCGHSSNTWRLQRTVAEYLAWEVSNIMKQKANTEDCLGK